MHLVFLALLVLVVLFVHTNREKYLPLPTTTSIPVPTPGPYVTSSPGDVESQLGALKASAAYATLLRTPDHAVMLNVALKNGQRVKFSVKFPNATAANNAIDRWARKLAPVPLRAAA